MSEEAVQFAAQNPCLGCPPEGLIGGFPTILYSPLPASFQLLDWENPGIRTEKPKREISQSRRMPRQQHMTSSSPWHHVNICENLPGFPMISVDQEAMKSMNRISRNRWCRSNFLSTCSYSEATTSWRAGLSGGSWRHWTSNPPGAQRDLRSRKVIVIIGSCFPQLKRSRERWGRSGQIR